MVLNRPQTKEGGHEMNEFKVVAGCDYGKFRLIEDVAHPNDFMLQVRVMNGSYDAWLSITNGGIKDAFGGMKRILSALEQAEDIHTEIKGIIAEREGVLTAIEPSTAEIERQQEETDDFTKSEWMDDAINQSGSLEDEAAEQRTEYRRAQMV